VFDGRKNAPYLEQDTPNPLNVYGHSKLAGEAAIRESGAAHLIFRTSWVYGVRGRNFLLTMLRLAKERDELKVIDDQIGAPTWSRQIALATARVICQLKTSEGQLQEHASNIYHLTAAGSTSWYGFAERIFATYAALGGDDRAPRLTPIPSEGYPSPARRPAYSVLSNTAFSKDWGFELPSWDEALRACLAEAPYLLR
jgi:dTDP-4-dehydrorhamnose reductase